VSRESLAGSLRLRIIGMKAAGLMREAGPYGDQRILIQTRADQ
jgi:hypothetical protein